MTTMSSASAPPAKAPGDLAIVAYDGMTALDAIGPFDVLRLLPCARVELVAERAGAVRTDSEQLTLTATSTFEQTGHPDVVVVPGGPGTAAVMSGALPAWLQTVHPGTRWTTSVCSGSLVLGAAGLLRGLEATSHFAVLGHLSSFGAHPVSERVVVQPQARIITAAGVSAGIDMALVLAEHLGGTLTAQAIALVLEYAPQPPFDTGSLGRAGADVVERAIEIGQPHGAIPAGWGP